MHAYTRVHVCMHMCIHVYITRVRVYISQCIPIIYTYMFSAPRHNIFKWYTHIHWAYSQVNEVFIEYCTYMCVHRCVDICFFSCLLTYFLDEVATTYHPQPARTLLQKRSTWKFTHYVCSCVWVCSVWAWCVCAFVWIFVCMSGLWRTRPPSSAPSARATAGCNSQKSARYQSDDIRITIKLTFEIFYLVRIDVCVCVCVCVRACVRHVCECAWNQKKHIHVCITWEWERARVCVYFFINAVVDMRLRVSCKDASRRRMMRECIRANKSPKPVL